MICPLVYLLRVYIRPLYMFGPFSNPSSHAIDVATQKSLGTNLGQLYFEGNVLFTYCGKIESPDFITGKEHND